MSLTFKRVITLCVFSLLTVSVFADPFAAVKNKDAAGLKSYLAAGGDPNAFDPSGETLLIATVYRSWIDGVRLLINAGADPNLRNRTAYAATPIQAALYMGLTDLFWLFTEKGAKPEGTMFDGENALHLAARCGDLKVVEHLIKQGIDVKAFAEGSYMSDGLTPLHYAAMNGDPAVIKALIRAGAEVDAPAIVDPAQKRVSLTSKGETPLMKAVIGDKIAAAEMLLKHGAHPDYRNTDTKTALMIAAHEEKVGEEMIVLLVKHGADLEARTEGNVDTVLKYAVMARNEKKIRLLVKLGAKIDACTTMTALMFALAEYDVAQAKVLIELGANPGFIVQKSGWTILHAAASNMSRAENLEYALSFGQAVDIRTARGTTPLMTAATFGSVKNVEILVKSGAKVNARDNDGFTALHYAVLSPFIASPRAKKEWFIPTIKQLIASGADRSIPDNKKKRPLDHVKDDPELAALLKP